MDMTFTLCVVLMEMFMMGIFIGSIFGQRENPNAPKPRNWDKEAQKQWNKGFRAGETSMARRMKSRLTDEELLRAYYDNAAQKP